MMYSPEEYLEELEAQDPSYEEMIEERDDLIWFIQNFEERERAGDRTGKAWQVNPSPEVRYQMSLEYLAVLCRVMKEKYNKEYVWGDRKLSDGN